MMMSRRPTARGPGRPPGGDAGRRDALLAAARELFAARGYAAASARDVATLAGATTPALYHHFGSKAGLYAAVARDVNDEVIGAFERAVAGHDRIDDRIDAVLDATVAMQADAPTIARFVVALPLELAHHPELELARPEAGRLAHFVRTMCADAHGLAVPPRHAEDVVLTLIFGLSRLAATSTARYVHAAESLKALIHGELVARGQ